VDVTRAAWRKSSYSSANGGNCIEVAAWRKSSRSSGNGGQCVEVADRPLHGAVAVRDSKDPDGPVLAVAPQSWQAFTGQVKAGAFDPA
jgi:Domain of unknown function (DUF397)